MTRTYELAAFLGEPLPVELVARLEEVHVDGASVVLRPEQQWRPAEQRWLFLHRYA